ncbi:MAG: alpha/beta hydrolase [Alphaproteobacteria bacterium]|nr:alpha/beta hydrolase [Alphaproteobacteria bacterium]
MNPLNIVLIVLAALAVLLTLAYIRADRETLSAAEFRADSGYQTATLSDGVTAYMDYGPKDAPPIIIVHGGTLGSMAYQGYVPPLVKDGWRVIIYDQYGRGFSDRPIAPLSIDMLGTQLLELLDYLNIDRAHLFGVSMGGAVIARFGATHGARVRALAYQVPVIGGVSVTPALIATRLPIIGKVLARLVGVPAIIARGESFGTESEEARLVVAHFKDQFAVKGTERMMRDMLIGDALGDRMADHQKIGASGMKAQFVYATDDPEIAAAQVEAALAFYDAPEVHQYTGGHFFSSGRTDELSTKLTAFFKQH